MDYNVELTDSANYILILDDEFKQNNNKYQNFKISILNNSNDKINLDNHIVRASFKKSDKKIIYIDCDIVDSYYIIVPITQDITSTIGQVFGDIEITKENKYKFYSQTFKFIINESIYNEQAIKSSDVVVGVDVFLNEIKEKYKDYKNTQDDNLKNLNNKLNEIKKDYQTQTQNISNLINDTKQNELQRQTSENQREINEKARQTSENQRQETIKQVKELKINIEQNELQRQTSENTREINEQKRTIKSIENNETSKALINRMSELIELLEQSEQGQLISKINQKPDKKYVDDKIKLLIGQAPEELDTLEEIASKIKELGTSVSDGVIAKLSEKVNNNIFEDFKNEINSKINNKLNITNFTSQNALKLDKSEFKAYEIKRENWETSATSNMSELTTNINRNFKNIEALKEKISSYKPVVDDNVNSSSNNPIKNKAVYNYVNPLFSEVIKIKKLIQNDEIIDNLKNEEINAFKTPTNDNKDIINRMLLREKGLGVLLEKSLNLSNSFLKKFNNFNEIIEDDQAINILLSYDIFKKAIVKSSYAFDKIITNQIFLNKIESNEQLFNDFFVNADFSLIVQQQSTLNTIFNNKNMLLKILENKKAREIIASSNMAMEELANSKYKGVRKSTFSNYLNTHYISLESSVFLSNDNTCIIIGIEVNNFKNFLQNYSGDYIGHYYTREIRENIKNIKTIKFKKYNDNEILFINTMALINKTIKEFENDKKSGSSSFTIDAKYSQFSIYYFDFNSIKQQQ